MTSEAAIYCDGLSRHYGDVVALDRLTLSVPYGSIFGFLGRNGAGKTTTMRLLTGLARPTAGRAWLAGSETTADGTGARKRYGYLPQAPAFYNWMTAAEYLDYVGQIQGLDSDDRRQQISDLLELSGLTSASKRRIGGFSGGMVQRLGIAQALLGSPEVLLLDEPTSSLDPAGRSEVLEMLAALRGRTTVFLSSHILSDIERVCDTVAVLHKGQLVLVSGREELLQKYAVNAAELELDSSGDGQSAAVSAFISVLETLDWPASISQESAVIRVMVHDLEKGKRELLPLAASHGLILNRFAWVRPSLEDIFLQLSS